MDEQNRNCKKTEKDRPPVRQEQEELKATVPPADNDAEKTGDSVDNTTVQSDNTETAPTADQACLPEHDVDKLEATIAEKNALIEAYGARLLRLQADFENFRRRTQKEKEELAAVITENVLRDFLPVMDNFQRALKTPDDTAVSSGIAAGVAMIYRQMMGILEKHGVSIIKAEGENFDPKLHEAVMRVSDADKPDGLIVEELQRGYLYRGTALRPSMVKVIANN